MTSDEHRDSLAAQAAAWVPPWERQAPPEPSAEAEPPAEVEPSAEVEVVAPAGPSAEAEPPAEVEPSAEVEVVAPAGPSAEVEASAETEPLDEVEAPAEVEALEVAEVEALDDRGDLPGPEHGEVSTITELPATGDEAVRVPDDDPEPAAALALIDEAELRAALEAILLVVDEPVTDIVLAQVLEQPTDRVAEALAGLSRHYTEAGHGFDLRRAAGGWRLYTRPEYASYVERFVLDGQQTRLTQAALETLAVVAYKQPVTRSRISAIRGVNCDGVIRTLVSRGLCEECGTEPETGAYLYRTTTLFLEKLGLDSVTELPPLAPFLPDDVEEIADAQR